MQNHEYRRPKASFDGTLPYSKPPLRTLFHSPIQLGAPVVHDSHSGSHPAFLIAIKTLIPEPNFPTKEIYNFNSFYDRDVLEYRRVGEIKVVRGWGQLTMNDLSSTLAPSNQITLISSHTNMSALLPLYRSHRASVNKLKESSSCQF